MKQQCLCSMRVKMFFLFSLNIFVFHHLLAQVSIGTDGEPQNFSILELSSNEGGFRLPQLTATERLGLTTKIGTNSNPLKAKGLLIYNSSDEVVEFWNGLQWTPLKNPWQVSTTHAVATSNDQNIYQKGNVSIGTDLLVNPAILNVNANDKGVLLPRVKLMGQMNPNPIAIDVNDLPVGLLVYNTGEDAGFPISGFMFWNGSSWRLLTDAPTVKANVSGGLINNTQILYANLYTTNSIDDFLEVGYTGGNGGYYSKGDPYVASVSGSTKEVILELQPGKLEGTGKLIYKITGKPGVAFPTAIDNLQLKFLNQDLGVISVGGIKTIEAVQYTLYDNIAAIKQGVNGANGVEKGYDGVLLKWLKNGELVDLKLPETGAYVFSFRLYGPTSGITQTNGAGAPFYISAFKQTGASPHLPGSSTSNLVALKDKLLDIAEMTVVKAPSYANCTYSVNLTVSGLAGDKIYFKIASAQSVAFSWGLSNGGKLEDVANRSSMIYWKL